VLVKKTVSNKEEFETETVSLTSWYIAHKTNWYSERKTTSTTEQMVQFYTHLSHLLPWV